MSCLQAPKIHTWVTDPLPDTHPNKANGLGKGSYQVYMGSRVEGLDGTRTYFRRYRSACTQERQCEDTARGS